MILFGKMERMDLSGVTSKNICRLSRRKKVGSHIIGVLCSVFLRGSPDMLFSKPSVLCEGLAGGKSQRMDSFDTWQSKPV